MNKELFKTVHRAIYLKEKKRKQDLPGCPMFKIQKPKPRVRAWDRLIKIPSEVQQTRIPIPGSDQDTITKPYLK